MSISKKIIFSSMPIIILFVVGVYLVVGLNDMRGYSIDLQKQFNVICNSVDFDIRGYLNSFCVDMVTCISNIKNGAIEVFESFTTSTSWWEKTLLVLKAVFTLVFDIWKTLFYAFIYPWYTLAIFLSKIISCIYGLLKCLFVDKSVIIKHKVWYEDLEDNLKDYQSIIDNVANYVKNLVI